MNLGKENECIEFKESLSQLTRALESLAAMLNKNFEGQVLFGVKDNGEVIGVSSGNKTLLDLSEAVTSRIKPTVIPTIKEENYDGKIVISISVKGHNRVYSADGKYLIRCGSENKKIDPNIMRELMFSNNNDIMCEIESANQDLTFNQLRQLYILKNLNINPDTFQRNIGLFNKNNKYNLLADILSDNNNYSIKVVRFAGFDKTNLLYRNEYGYKCLLLAMEQALGYVLSLNETRVILSGSSKREEMHLFDENSFREAWNNACLHSRWDKMNPPSIFIFDDRIEIISTGGLPFGYSLDDFYRGISNTLNQHLSKIMVQLGYIEQTGHGVPEIIKHYGKEAFDIRDNFIIVTLKFPFLISKNSNDFSSLTTSQEKVFKAIINKPTITIDDLVKVVGLSTSSINVILKELKELNKIKRVGAKKNGYWEIIK